METLGSDHEGAFYGALASLAFEELPDSTVAACQAVVLDHFACAVVGMQLPWTRQLIDVLDAAGEMRTTRGAGARVYGREGPVPPLSAALVNGTATHGLDLDDTHLPTMTHPGCVVIPAVFAAADSTATTSGRAVLLAVLSGYEAMGRIAAATGLGFGERGFHATGQVGPMAAAAACCTVLGLPADMYPGAVGLAASLGGGIKAFSTGSGEVKRLHAGRAAQSGLLAVLLQRSGFSGPTEAIAGSFGFVPAFSTDERPDYRRLDAAQSGFVVDDIYLKPYAACAAAHGAIAAAAALSVESLDAIAKVVVGTSRRALQQNDIPEPDGIVAAQYSVQYSVALTLAGEISDPLHDVRPRATGERRIRELCRRTVLELDDSAQEAYPDRNEARVDVWFHDGSVRSARAAVPRADEHIWDQAQEKFFRVTSGLLSERQQEDLLGAIAALAEDGDPAACLDALEQDQERSASPMRHQRHPTGE